MSTIVRMAQVLDGDCIWIRCGKEAIDGKMINIVIDSGPKGGKNTFTWIMNKIKDRGEAVNLMIFTHDDSDHIKAGQLYIQERGSITSTANSLFNIGTEVKDAYLSAKEMTMMLEDLNQEDQVEQYGSLKDIGLVLADTVKGDSRGVKINSNSIEIRWENLNDEYKKNRLKCQVIKETNKNNVLNPEEERAVITILSPDTEMLKRYVNKKWRKQDKINFLSQKVEFRGKGDWNKSIATLMEEEITFGQDKSESNGASIAFLFEYEDVRLLFMGDALPDIVLKYGKKLLDNGKNKLEERKEDIGRKFIHLDFMKMAHHGSHNNITSEFIDFFKTDTYLISTNGPVRDQNPSKATFTNLLKYPEDGNICSIYGNYSWWRKSTFAESEEPEYWADNQNNHNSIYELKNKKINFIQLEEKLTLVNKEKELFIGIVEEKN